MNTEMRAWEQAGEPAVTVTWEPVLAAPSNEGTGDIPATRRFLSSEGNLGTFGSYRGCMADYGAVVVRDGEIPATDSVGAQFPAA